MPFQFLLLVHTHHFSNFLIFYFLGFDPIGGLTYGALQYVLVMGQREQGLEEHVSADTLDLDPQGVGLELKLEKDISHRVSRQVFPVIPGH